MKNIFLSFFILISIIFAGSFGYSIYLHNKYEAPSQNRVNSTISSLRFPEKIITEKKLKDITPTSSSSMKFNGWMPTWAMDAGIRSFDENKSRFETISPVFYVIQDSGEINVNKNGLDRIQNLVSGTRVKIVPTISSFNPDALRKNLNDSDTFNNFLIKEIEQNNYDGIDLNYESTFLEDKDKFFAHLKVISEYTRSKGKVFSVTVLSKWGDQINYGFAPQTRQVQDYAEIAKYADQIRIMTYDYTSQGSANAGPIAPIEWMEQVLQYATNRVYPKKIVLGIHLYGYFWGAGEARARALDYRQISEIKSLNTNPDSFYSEKNKESALKYIGPGTKTFFGYHSSPESIQARLELAAKYGLNSVVFWRLGNDPL